MSGLSTAPREGYRVLALEDIKMRAEMASRLAEAIEDAYPDDAAQLMTAALLDLSAGYPSGFLSADEDAKWWASVATPPELVAMMTATMERLGDRALHLSMRKRLFVALWAGMPESDRKSFLSKVDPEGQFHGPGARP